jgi:hypothetical protein
MLYSANTNVGELPAQADASKENWTMASRVVTVRLPEEQVAALETVASFDGVALAEELREGVQLLLAARRNDPEFHTRVQESFERARRILEGVEGAEPVIEALRPVAQAAAAAQQAAIGVDEATLAGDEVEAEADDYASEEVVATAGEGTGEEVVAAAEEAAPATQGQRKVH